MEQTHPNVALLTRFDPNDPATAADVVAPDFVWHYFNPKLPDLQGDYAGAEGLREFFRKLSNLSEGTFTVNPVSATPVGNELVITQVRNTMLFEGESIAINAVVVWRIVEGRIAEAWDIPAVYELAEPLADPQPDH